MTLEELSEGLPNGLHDARIKRSTHDYEKATVKLNIEILVGLPEDPPGHTYGYRDGEIVFHRSVFCAVQVPGSNRSLQHPGSIWFTFERTQLDHCWK